MTLDLGAILDQLHAYFATQDARWAVAGGLALGAHGVTRSTFDVDIAVPRAHQATLIAFLESQGFETLHQSRGFSNHLNPKKGRVDVVYVGEDTATKLWHDVKSRSVLGRSLPVPSAVHLIAMKLVAFKNDPSRRLQDLADIRSLITSASLDRAEVRTLFERYDLVEDADLV